MLQKLFASLAGKFIAKRLNLKEGQMDSKKWFESKTVWANVVTVLFGIYALVQTNLAPQFNWTLPAIPGWLISFLGAIGVYGRVTADKSIE